MKVHTYAVLKDYFEKEFDIEDSLTTVHELHNFLTQQNPAAASILSACRYAVKDRFVNNDYALSKEDDIHIMPPSSGG